MQGLADELTVDHLVPERADGLLGVDGQGEGLAVAAERLDGLADVDDATDAVELGFDDRGAGVRRLVLDAEAGGEVDAGRHRQRIVSRTPPCQILSISRPQTTPTPCHGIPL